MFVLLIVLHSFFQLGFAQSDEPMSRDFLVRESIANLDSGDVHVASQAARNLGIFRAKEGVPALLRVLQSSRSLSTIENIDAKDKDRMSFWVSTDVRAEIINSLGLIGDQRAVPVLKKYLKPPKNSTIYPGNVAQALYLLTGKSYEYKDYDGQQKLYRASPLTEEEFRKRFRPDLKAAEGLTASLEIEGSGPKGAFWVGERSLVINLVITNHSKRVIEVDGAPANFLFSSVVGSGERIDIPARLLPSPQTSEERAVLKPGQRFILRWELESLKESPLSQSWSGYVNIKCVYTNPRKERGGAIWRGDRLISNTVERPYYSSIENALGSDSP